MADETTPVVEAEPVPETPVEPAVEDIAAKADNPDAVSKAIKSEREAAKKAKAERDDALSRIKEFEDAQKSEDEKRVEALDAERKRAETAESRIQELEVKQLRGEVAAEKKLPPKLAGRLTGGTREEIEADADALLEDLGTLPGETPPPGDGGARTPVQPKDLEAQIREAEAEGDYRKSMSLKSQQLVAMKAR